MYKQNIYTYIKYVHMQNIYIYGYYIMLYDMTLNYI
jgi:hypothetical protein